MYTCHYLNAKPFVVNPFKAIPYSTNSWVRVTALYRGTGELSEVSITITELYCFRMVTQNGNW